MLWIIAGFLAMFILERFICFHHHEMPSASDACGHHEHTMSWIATGFGLTLHGVMAGVALAASVILGASQGVSIPGLALSSWRSCSTNPFDAMSLIAIMTVTGRSRASRMLVNLLFSLVTPAGVLLGWWLGTMPGEASPPWLGPALGFAVGNVLMRVSE